MSVLCPKCKKEGAVLDSRLIAESGTRIRRRECIDCEVRWNTWEVGHDMGIGDLRRQNQELRKAISEIRSALGALIK
jgi:transcriptional regulator NrdR family protein